MKCHSFPKVKEFDIWFYISRLWNRQFIFTKGSSIYDVHKKWPIFWPPWPHHPQNWTTDLLFKSNRISKHVTNFKTPPPPFRMAVINVCSITGTGDGRKRSGNIDVHTVLIGEQHFLSLYLTILNENKYYTNLYTPIFL